MRWVAVGLACLAVAAAPAATPAQDAVRYLQGREGPSGGFAEPGGDPGLGLSAWAVLGLRAAGAEVSPAARAYLERARPDSATDTALLALAQHAAGADASEHVARLRALVRPTGAIGPTVNSTIWSVIALRQARAPVPKVTVRWLLARQSKSGGWGWTPRGSPDSNDTAAAIQALRACGVRGKPITRALAYLRRLQNPDGGFELSEGRGSDAQSTAWAIQGFLAAGAPVPRRAYAYLARLRRVDGSYRYSARYAVTPAWVTAQVLPALARKPFPLR